MNIKIVGKDFKVTDGLKTHIENSSKKISHFVKDNIPITIILRAPKNRYKVEVTIPVKDGVIRIEEENKNDIYNAIDKAFLRMERHLRKYNDKLHDKYHGKINNNDIVASVRINNSELVDDIDEFDVEVVRTKTVDAVEMSVEDAIFEMNLTSHNFYGFINVETGKFAIIYKRKDGNVGIINFT